jgi:kumamolisin
MTIPGLHSYAKVNAHVLPGEHPWAIPDLLTAYGWPVGAAGTGVIAIIELGGGWNREDVVAAFTAMNLPDPIIVDVSVDDTKNTPGGDADGEVALDIQVAGAAFSFATNRSARISIYWCKDIADGVAAAAKDGCAVCSISWGSDEANWGEAEALRMEAVARSATSKGMVIFAASGDNDSADGGDTPANVDLPASCPHIVGCGGTMKPVQGEETVWNNDPGNPSGEGTGGGYSTIFPVQAWQIGIPGNATGRMVPDVAANADPTTGYEIVLNGSTVVYGGTSAVAPLYAGLFAAFDKVPGHVNPTLYQNQLCFTNIITGDNGTFKASVGPDPCTGLGSPKPDLLMALF